MPNFRQKDIQTPHYAMPFRLGSINGAAIVNEQDSSEDIINCIEAIIAFPIGSREELPEFGIPDILFREITESQVPELQEAIARWETRIDLIASEEPTFDDMIRHIILQARGSDPE